MCFRNLCCPDTTGTGEAVSGLVQLSLLRGLRSSNPHFDREDVHVANHKKDADLHSDETSAQELDRRTFMGTTGGLLAALASGGLAANSVQAHAPKPQNPNQMKLFLEILDYLTRIKS